MAGVSRLLLFHGFLLLFNFCVIIRQRHKLGDQSASADLKKSCNVVRTRKQTDRILFKNYNPMLINFRPQL